MVSSWRAGSRRGDFIVQNAAFHGWRNRSGETLGRRAIRDPLCDARSGVGDDRRIRRGSQQRPGRGFKAPAPDTVAIAYWERCLVASRDAHSARHRSRPPGTHRLSQKSEPSRRGCRDQVHRSREGDRSAVPAALIRRLTMSVSPPCSSRCSVIMSDL
jgi:hypothetical protein